MFLKKILVVLMLGCGSDQLAAARSRPLEVKTDISFAGFAEYFKQCYWESKQRYNGRVSASNPSELTESWPEGRRKHGFINDLAPKSGLVRCTSCGELERRSAKAFFKAP